ncbi:MAG TPA: hypothetical protein VEI26_10205 [Terriglobales bacterium]|nr:hypothetical protein [Terriglobales bacterium]
MPRMIDSIRKSALPSNMMQFAAKGALLVPPQEMIEILVYLANHNKVFGQQARLTLAGWDEVSSREAAANPQTPREVLDYFIDPENLRPSLLPVLLQNPSVAESFLIRLAASASREQVELILSSSRASASKAVLETLSLCPSVTQATAAKVQEKLAALKGAAQTASVVVEEPGPSTETSPPPEVIPAENPANSVPDQEETSADMSDETVNDFIAKHAAEIAAEGKKSFEPVSGLTGELTTDAAEQPKAKAAAAAASTPSADANPQRAPQKKWILSADEQRGSALQKISKLDTKGRILLAMKGTKEERSLLIRDGTKIVALAVLESPKVTDSEVERFASQKNVLEAVLREISMKRRFIKQYPILRNLVFNPRTPIDVSLGLLKNLLIQDLRNLSGNKEVCDTVRKLATKMFRQKLDVTKKS